MQGERMNMTKIRVLMVCYGNICRSPMSEFVFKENMYFVFILIGGAENVY